MKKINKLSVAVATVLALMCTGSVFAAPDKLGDGMIQVPANKTIVDVASVDVWFAQIEGAVGYSYDLIGTAAGANKCGNTAPADMTTDVSGIISAAGLDCGQETQATKAGDGDKAGVHLCKWTTPVLANGDYALAINPITIGTKTVSMTEKREGDCKNDATNGRENNKAEDMVDITKVPAKDNQNYQLFTVDIDTSTTTQAPNIPEPLYPAAGAEVDDALAVDATGVIAAPGVKNDKLTFTDSSPDAGMATWYELWIYDKSNTRVTDAPSNPTFSNWYKVGVDSELVCADNANAAGDRICSIDITDSVLIGGQSSADLFTWWVKSYNLKGISSWSSAPGTFKHDAGTH